MQHGQYAQTGFPRLPIGAIQFGNKWQSFTFNKVGK